MDGSDVDARETRRASHPVDQRPSHHHPERGRFQRLRSTRPLIKVLGSMGPAAVPALLQIAEASTVPYVTFDALDEIARLEPRTNVFGQSLSPWLSWRPNDERSNCVGTRATTAAPAKVDGATASIEAADSSHVALLLPLLDDQAASNGQTVAQVVVESLQRLTFEPLGADTKTWSTWFETNRGVSRGVLVARRVKAHLDVVRQVPIWEANRWIDEFDGSDGAALLPLIDQYLDRRDLNASTVGPNSSRGRGGSGPIGMHGPRIVTLLLDMTIRQVPGALQRLTASLDAADPQVRTFGSLALAAFNRTLAIERLAIEAKSPEAWHRSRASEFLLQLGDSRGIPARLEAFANDQQATRMFACRDLRVYTQQPMSCDASASGPDRAVNVGAWKAWWEREEPTFRVKTREAELDLRVLTDHGR